MDTDPLSPAEPRPEARPLDEMTAAELRERADALEAEAARLRGLAEQRDASREAADALFGKN